MPITNQRAINFSNEVIRPLSEEFRRLKADIDAATVAWFGGINALFPNDSSVVEDGRAADGVSILTGADVTNVMTQLLAFQSQLSGLGVADVISKPCTRWRVSDVGYVR